MSGAEDRDLRSRRRVPACRCCGWSPPCPTRASDGSVLTLSPSRSASGWASRRPVSSVITTNSAPVRVRAAFGHRLQRAGRQLRRRGSARPRRLMASTSARTDGSEATVRASVRAWFSASRPSRSYVSQACTAPLSSTTSSTTPSWSRSVWVENRSGGRGAGRSLSSLTGGVLGGSRRRSGPCEHNEQNAPNKQYANQLSQRHGRDGRHSKSVARITPLWCRSHEGAGRAGITWIRHDRGIHGADHDEEVDASTGADHRPHRFWPVRRCRPGHRRHGPGLDEVHDLHRSPADVRHHLLRPDDRRRTVRPAGAVHPPQAGQRPGQGGPGHRHPRCRRVPGRRRLHHLHPHHRRHAADLPAPEDEPRGPHLRGRPRQRHHEHRALGRSHGPRRHRTEDRRQRRLRPHDPVADRAASLWSSSSPGSWACRNATASAPPHRKSGACPIPQQSSTAVHPPAGRRFRTQAVDAQRQRRPGGAAPARRSSVAVLERTETPRGRPRLRHGGHRTGPQPQHPAPQAVLVQPGPDRGRHGHADRRPRAAALRLHGGLRHRPAGQLPQGQGPGRPARGPRHRRSSPWSAWSWPRPSSPAS